MLPDFGATMGDRGSRVYVVGMGVMSIDEYDHHCEITAIIHDDAYPLGRMITLATMQSIAAVFAVLSSAPADTHYAMRATIGRPITGQSGERYRPLLGIFGHMQRSPDELSRAEVVALQCQVDRTTVADIKAQFRLLLPTAIPNYLASWGLVDQAAPGGLCRPLPAHVLTLCDAGALADLRAATIPAEEMAARQAKRSAPDQ